MGRVEKSILFDGTAIVSCLDTTDIVNKAISFHKLEEIPSIALGKVLTIAAFFSSCLKGLNNKSSFIIRNTNKLGNITVSCAYGGKVRGYLDNPHYKDERKIDNEDKLINAIKSDNSELVVIKDFGLKNPYNAFSPIINGNIARDFEYYYAKSEQLNTLIFMDVVIKENKCKKAGAIIIQPMPNCTEEQFCMLEDTAKQLKDFIPILEKHSPKEIIDFYFEYFNKKDLEGTDVSFECTCSREKVQGFVVNLPKDEIESILKEKGAIKIHCDFCNTTYEFKKEFFKKQK